MPPCDADPASRADAEPCHSTRESRPPAASPGGLVLDMRLPARLATPWLVRARLREWLDSLGWPTEQVDDIEYAVSEAVSNVAEHAYRPASDSDAYDLSARLEELPDGSRRIAITVRDDGCWQPLDPDPGMRGRGLFMMRTLMADVTIRRGEGAGSPGTEVVMLSRAVPSRNP